MMRKTTTKRLVFCLVFHTTIKAMAAAIDHPVGDI